MVLGKGLNRGSVSKVKPFTYPNGREGLGYCNSPNKHKDHNWRNQRLSDQSSGLTFQDLTLACSSGKQIYLPA
jgi:hypothetical protein